MLENLREFADESLPRKALVNTRETSTNTRDFARTKSTRGFPFPRREQKRPNGSRPYSYSTRTPKVSLYRNLPNHTGLRSKSSRWRKIETHSTGASDSNNRALRLHWLRRRL